MSGMGEHYKVGDKVMVDTPGVIGQGTITAINVLCAETEFEVEILGIKTWVKYSDLHRKVDW